VDDASEDFGVEAEVIDRRTFRDPAGSDGCRCSPRSVCNSRGEREFSEQTVASASSGKPGFFEIAVDGTHDRRNLLLVLDVLFDLLLNDLVKRLVHDQRNARSYEASPWTGV